MERAAYTPKEFAALFGKSQTWGYRQIYSGKVASTTEHGRTLIPAKEVERVLQTAQRKGEPAKKAKPAPARPESVREMLIRGTKASGKSARNRSGMPPRKPTKEL